MRALFLRSVALHFDGLEMRSQLRYDHEEKIFVTGSTQAEQEPTGLVNFHNPEDSHVKIRELRSKLRNLDKAELVEILVEMYKTLPKPLIEETAMDDMITNRSEYLEMLQREKEAAKRIRESYREENMTTIAAMQKWETIPEYARQLILNNVWCAHCGDTFLKEYTVEPAGPDIVLRGTCPVCQHKVARHVEIE